MNIIKMYRVKTRPSEWTLYCRFYHVCAIHTARATLFCHLSHAFNACSFMILIFFFTGKAIHLQSLQEELCSERQFEIPRDHPRPESISCSSSAEECEILKQHHVAHQTLNGELPLVIQNCSWRAVLSGRAFAVLPLGFGSTPQAVALARGRGAVL